MAKKDKLTISQVIEIRRLLVGRKSSHSRIATVYGVSKSSIADISIGKNWGWLPDLEQSDLPLIRSLADDGMDPAELADKFDTSVSGMRKLLKQLALEAGNDKPELHLTG